MTNTLVAVLGIDLGKNSCSLAGLDATGAVVLRRRMTREGVVAFVAKLPACAPPTPGSALHAPQWIPSAGRRPAHLARPSPSRAAAHTSGWRSTR
jgi:hypothetical protein